MDDEYLPIHLDIDIWSYGRDAAFAGRYTNPMLKASYPWVEINRLDEVKWMKVLQAHFEPNHNDQYPFLMRIGFVCFQNREDRDLFQGLMYLY